MRNAGIIEFFTLPDKTQCCVKRQSIGLGIERDKWGKIFSPDVINQALHDHSAVACSAMGSIYCYTLNFCLVAKYANPRGGDALVVEFANEVDCI